MKARTWPLQSTAGSLVPGDVASAPYGLVLITGLPTPQITGPRGIVGVETTQRKKTLQRASWPHAALPVRVHSQPCPWNCHYEFRLFQNPTADGSKGAQLLSGNGSGRSPLNTKKLRCNQPGWNSGKRWPWGWRRKDHVSRLEQAHLPSFHLPAGADPLPPRPLPGAPRPQARDHDPAAGGQECSVIAAPSCSLAPASNLSVVVSKAKHEPGFSMMVAILACNFITRI